MQQRKIPKLAARSPKSKKTDHGSSSKRDQFAVVLEDMCANFKAIGESLDMTRKVIYQHIDQRADELKGEIKVLTFRIAQIDERVSRLEQANLELLKEIRENTVSRKEFEALREEVRRLKAELASR